MALRAIKDFPKATPSTEDLILIEQQGGGRSVSLKELPVSTPVEKKISDVKKDLNDKISALAFEPGDTTGDAELRNIRTPADGFTVPANANAGDAVRAQVTQLDEKISNLKGDLGNYSNINFSLNPSDFSIGTLTGQGNGAVNSKRIYAGQNYIAKVYEYPFSLKIMSINGYKLRLFRLNADGTVASIVDNTECELNANEKFKICIRFVNETDAPDISVDDIPSIVDSVLLFTPIQNKLLYLENSIISETTERENKDSILENQINSFAIYTEKECEYTKINGKYILADGSIKDGNNIFYTSLVEIKRGEKLEVKSEMPNNGDYAIVSRWTDDSTFAETLFHPKATGLKTFSITAENDMYVRFCGVPTLTLDTKIIHTNSDLLDFVKGYVIDDDFKKEQSPLYGIKWDTLGDSLTAAGTLSYAGNYTDIIANANGMSLNNVAIGGKSWWNGIISEEVPNVRSDADIITIFGSFNNVDLCFAKLGTKNDVASASGSFCARVKNIFNSIYAIKNDVKIGVILPTPWVNFNPYDTSEEVQMQIEEYLKALTDVCHMYSIPVLDLYHESMTRPWDETFRNTYYKQVYDSETQTYTGGDGVHPNTLGHKKFVAPRIEQFLKSMCSNY